MKSSTTSSATARGGSRSLERTRRTAVALLIRDESLSATLTARLTAAGDAVALPCPAADAAELLAWLSRNRCDLVLLDHGWRALLVELLSERAHAAGRGPLDNGADGKLTRREAEVVGYVRRGFANKQIADSLAIREDTVKKHLRNAYLKLGVHRRSEIITAGAEPHVGN
jgi:DNA-binding CsgD family transcriptional regulator